MHKMYNIGIYGDATMTTFTCNSGDDTGSMVRIWALRSHIQGYHHIWDCYVSESRSWSIRLCFRLSATPASSLTRDMASAWCSKSIRGLALDKCHVHFDPPHKPMCAGKIEFDANNDIYSGQTLVCTSYAPRVYQNSLFSNPGSPPHF